MVFGVMTYMQPELIDSGPPVEMQFDQDHTIKAHDLLLRHNTSETLVPTTLEHSVILTSTSEEPAEGGADWVLYLSIIIGVIEVVARLLPNSNVTGLLGLLINLLKEISDFLNRGDP